jgi:hypothetical protein
MALVAALAVLAAPAAGQTPPRSTVEQAADSAGRVAAQPLRDLNVTREGIPPEIEAIMEDPYSLKGLKGCADYRAAIDRITKVIGPDVDSKEAREASGTSAEFMIGAAESAVLGLIPGRGLIRQVSGASAAEKRARAATLAGSLRRAFLKGRMSGLNCKA